LDGLAPRSVEGSDYVKPTLQEEVSSTQEIYAGFGKRGREK
jgi:hypothetical protein